MASQLRSDPSGRHNVQISKSTCKAGEGLDGPGGLGTAWNDPLTIAILPFPGLALDPLVLPQTRLVGKVVWSSPM